ncbi:MAG: hypothetical protein LBT14_07215 [Treponema sp.]|jgi:hypothetical protein|nr:hypothetical protein [Treponema sp.]
MANLKSLRIKNKEYVFKSFGNDQEKYPAKVVFNRFPIHGEDFTVLDRVNLFDGVDAGKVDDKNVQKIISDKIINTFLHNLQSGKIDYERFFLECVNRIDNLEYEGIKIKTVLDFWKTIPIDAAHVIADELYRYASERDEFTMGESTA